MKIDFCDIGDLVKFDTGGAPAIGMVTRLRSYTDATKAAAVTATFYTLHTYFGDVNITEEKIIKNLSK